LATSFPRTANLIKLKLKVKDEFIKVLPVNKTTKVHGIDVTLIEANQSMFPLLSLRPCEADLCFSHSCPGSVLFLFEGPHTDSKSPYSKTPSRIFRYLHCGGQSLPSPFCLPHSLTLASANITDFRASPAHVLHPSIKGKKIDIVYLDTTYLDSKYCFPAQDLVVSACAQLVRERVVDGDEGALSRTAGEGQAMMKGWLKDGAPKKEEAEGDGDGMQVAGEATRDAKDKEKFLVLVGTYSIGKERYVAA
jgi:DNA cross-link repair 1A protein